MRHIKLLVISLMLMNSSLFGQKYSGSVFDKKTGQPIEYVNIGVVGKNIGTVSNSKGEYALEVDSQFDSDTLKISCIGYNPYLIVVSDFKMWKNFDIKLEERVFELAGVVIRPKVFKQQILGVETKSRHVQAGFRENHLGYELGILMKVKKSAVIEKVNINFSTCGYDTIFYRLNIYKAIGENEFENILRNPIYLKLPKDKLTDKVVVDMLPYNLVVQGNFLVTLEHVKNLGEGHLYFCAGILDKTYYRKTSQAKWETVGIGVSISVDAKVEK
jgi:hypothetical protein